MATYLIRKNGRYSYRRRYPIHVAERLGRVEFVQALGTADPKEAARLARAVSVKFDDECEAILAKFAKELSGALEGTTPVSPSLSDADIATSVFDSLPGIIRTMTQSVIAEQANNKAGWQDSLDWRRRGLQAHIDGQMPAGIQMHPLVARTALDALEAAAKGIPLTAPAIGTSAAGTQAMETSAQPTRSDEGPQLTRRLLDAAFTQYAVGKTVRRKHVARRCAERTLSLPCTKAEAKRTITDWCVEGLSNGKAPSSVWTEASAVVALLKFVPGWHEFSVSKIGELRQLRGAGRARAETRAPMPVSVLHTALRNLPGRLPRNGDHWHAALLVCALYGLRPGELLQAGTESLQQHRDIFGNERLVFKVGVTGAKNEASKRDLPVPAELRPLFELALRMGPCVSETTRTRVERLNKLVKMSQEADGPVTSLYSIRHLFADVARACNFTDAQFGPIMGHTSSQAITAIYGGKAPLDGQAEILKAVKAKLFPDGLSPFWPVGLTAPLH